MSVDSEGSPGAPQQQMDEEELRRRLAEELKKVHVRDVLLQNVVTLINVGGQRLGLGDAADARDLDQAKLAIEGVRVTLPLIEERSPGELAPLRDALAQLQMAFAHEAGAAGGGGEGSETEGAGGEPPQTATEGGSERPPGKPPGPGGGGQGGLWVPPGSQT